MTARPKLERAGRKWRLLVLPVFFLLLGIAWLLPAEGKDPFCPFRRLAGLPCLLCGGTRATRAFVAGNWGEAFYLNAFVLGGWIFCSGLVLLLLLEAATGRRLLPEFAFRIKGRLVALGALLLVAAWGVQVACALLTPKPELLYDRSLLHGIRALFP